MATDIVEVQTTTELLKSLMKEQNKQHLVRDALLRMQFSFMAPINAVAGTPCMCTEYVYYGTSNIIRARQERVYKWKAAWDTDFVFNPSTDYDPDGDGEL